MEETDDGNKIHHLRNCYQFVLYVCIRNTIGVNEIGNSFYYFVSLAENITRCVIIYFLISCTKFFGKFS